MSFKHIRLFLLIAVGTVLLMTYQSHLGPIRPFGFITLPLNFANKLVGSAGRSIRDAYRTASLSRQRLEALEDENARLRMAADEQKEISIENERLMKMLDLKERQARFVTTALVVSRGSDAWSSVLVVDKGSKDGVAKDMTAITPDGLLGKVSVVDASFSKVLLIDDPTFAVSVRMQNSRTDAVLTGRGRGRCAVKYLRSDTSVSVGEPLVTSGIDALFPSGLMAAVITSVDTNERKIFHEVEAMPFVNVSRVEEVMLVQR